MISFHNLFYSPSLFTKEQCDRILTEHVSGDWKDGTIEWEEGERIQPELRSSKIKWLTDQWVFDHIWPWMQGANEKAGWKYDIKAMEDIQLTRYEPGDFYNFHSDGFGCHNVKAPNTGWCRKLSMSIFLNDDYEGGEFQFIKLCKGEMEIITQEHVAGSAVIFPSNIEHRVKPVYTGVRYSLVIWFVGPPFT